jgi:protein tyrosine phosphatase (PTP) superfamily phosphohydrolase (DUF442 family)
MLDSARPAIARRPLGRTARRFILAIASAAAVTSIGIALWFFVVRDRVIPKRFGVVVPGEVYRSGQISRHLIAGVIDRYHLGTIIDLNGVDVNDPDQQAEIAVARSKGLQHFNFPLKGNATGKIERYADAVATLARAEQSRIPVLVHCYAGTQRTGACVSFYRLLVRGDQPSAVYDELLRYGWDPATDQILVDYVNSHMRELAELLVQRHVLEHVPAEIPSLHP